MNEPPATIDCWMLKWIEDALASEQDWLAHAVKMSQTISDYRLGLQSDWYGFEWALQTVFGSFLLMQMQKEQNDASKIRKPRIDQKTQGVQPDLWFMLGPREIALQLKAVKKGNLGETIEDVKKQYPPEWNVYFLTVSYPFDGEWGSIPNTIRVPQGDGKTAEGFRYVLMRKTSL